MVIMTLISLVTMVALVSLVLAPPWNAALICSSDATPPLTATVKSSMFLGASLLVVVNYFRIKHAFTTSFQVLNVIPSRFFNAP